MPIPVDMAGKRYGRLVGLYRIENHGKRTFWSFQCDCGREKEIDAAHVRYRRIVSCGCHLASVLRSERHRQHCIAAAKHPRSHGMSGTPVHAVWKAMLERCRNPRAHDYRWYGALGVRVCDRWKAFENFYADMGEPKGLTLDRIDPTGNYEPANCRWATWDEQRVNKRRYAAHPST